MLVSNGVKIHVYAEVLIVAHIALLGHVTPTQVSGGGMKAEKNQSGGPAALRAVSVLDKTVFFFFFFCGDKRNWKRKYKFIILF